METVGLKAGLAVEALKEALMGKPAAPLTQGDKIKAADFGLRLLGCER